MKKAIYALSADPITHGHRDVVERALEVFDTLVVAIGINAAKKYTFNADERVALAKAALSGLKVEVVKFEGLLVDFAYEQGIRTIVRGVRNGTDFSFEQMLHDINYGQSMGVDTVIIISDKSLSHVSSSAVKELVNHGAKEILDYVGMPVKSALEQRLIGQIRVGVTGEIGVGKSTLCNSFQRNSDYGDVENIDLDDVGRRILTLAEEPFCHDVRRVISKKMSIPIDERGMLDVKAVSRQIFERPLVRSWFGEVMREPILYFLRKTLRKKNCLALVGSALLVEESALGVVNNNVILIKASQEERMRRLLKRGYTKEHALNRMAAQFSTKEKAQRIQHAIEVDGYGSLLELDNTDTDENALHDNVQRMETWISSLNSHRN